MNRKAYRFALVSALTMLCSYLPTGITDSDAIAPPVYVPAPYVYPEDTAQATHVVRYDLCIIPGVSIVFRTGDLSQSWADPQMHLLKSVGGNYQEVAYDDDSYDGVNAYIQLNTLPGSGSCTNYRVLVRARSNASGGNGGATFKLYVGTGQFSSGTFPLGGYTLTLNSDNALSSTDTLTTVRVNEGASESMLYRFEWDGDHYKYAAYNSFSEFGPGTATISGSSASRNQFVVATPYSTSRQGPIRIVRNDGVDSDGDGLANGAELAIGTCYSSTGCAAVDPKDTDGDGIRDGYEFVGKASELFPQEFPRWGADPLHRDIFVEVDRQSWDSDDDSVTEIGPSVSETALQYAAERFDAISVLNPDGDYGIHVHFDVDHPCSNELGDLDGVPGDDDGITSVCGMYGGANFATSPQNVHPFDLADANLSFSRKNLFRWALSTDFGSGQGRAPGSIIYFNGNGGLSVGAVIAHELGHNAGLQHWGAPAGPSANRMPHYPSMMNYNYSYQLNGSIENVLFSDGARAALNPSSLSETSYSPGSDVSFLTGAPFFFDTQPGFPNRIDWNRDGDFDSSVQAQVMSAPFKADYGGSDLPTLQGMDDVAGGVTDVGPGAANALATAPNGSNYKANWIVINGANDNRLYRKLQFTDGPYAGIQTNWAASSNIHRSDSEPEVVSFDSKVYVMAVLATGSLAIGKHAASGAASYSYLAPPAGVTFSSVSGAVRGGTLYLIARDVDTQILWASSTSDGSSYSTWQKTVESGDDLLSRVQPGLATGPDGNLNLFIKKFELGAEDNRLVHYSSSNGVSWALVEVAPESGNCRINGKPGAAWSPHLDANGTRLPSGNGAFRLWYTVQGDSCGGFNSQHRVSRGESNSSSGLGANFSLGPWHYSPLKIEPSTGTGNCHVDETPLAGSAVVDTGDRVEAIVVQIGNATNCPDNLVTIPNAFGIVDIDYPDTNDEQIIADSLCDALWPGQPCKCNDLSSSCSALASYEDVECNWDIPYTP